MELILNYVIIECLYFQTLPIALSAYSLFISMFIEQVMKSKKYIHVCLQFCFISSSDKSIRRILILEHASCMDCVFYFLHEEGKIGLGVWIMTLPFTNFMPLSKSVSLFSSAF